MHGLSSMKQKRTDLGTFRQKFKTKMKSVSVRIPQEHLDLIEENLTAFVRRAVKNELVAMGLLSAEKLEREKINQGKEYKYSTSTPKGLRVAETGNDYEI